MLEVKSENEEGAYFHPLFPSNLSVDVNKKRIETQHYNRFRVFLTTENIMYTTDVNTVAELKHDVPLRSCYMWSLNEAWGW